MSEEAEESDPPNTDDSENEVIKEEVKLQIPLYVSVLAIIYYGSWILPGICFFSYILLLFYPYVLDISNFFTLFTDFKSLIAFFSMPLVLIGCYVLRLFMLGLMTRILWKITEKISPSKDGVIPRNIRSRTADYYHLRSFMIKYGKNTFIKGALTWMSNWFFNFVGSNKIGKGTTLEESVGMDKFIHIGENCYIGINSTLASHLIQGVFGNISYFEIHVGNNVTSAAMSQIGPGTEIKDNAFLLPLSSTPKHSILKGDNYYIGIPMRKIFRKKVMDYLDLTPKELEKNSNIEGYKDKKLLKKLKEQEFSKDKIDKMNKEIKLDSSDVEPNKELEDPIDINNLSKEDLAIDFTTSSAISRVNIKFLAVYVPIFFVSGLIVSIFWYWYLSDKNWIPVLAFLPFALFGSIYFFTLVCILFSKLFLILVNLIHKPKEGIFKAELGDTDFEFWALRTELRKIGLWFIRNSPLPWTDVLALKLYGVDMDFSSHLPDAWCDAEFIKFGRKDLIGQGATIMSSMVIGKYLIIERVVLDDYVMIGGHTTIAPGTIIGKESVIGAISSTNYGQVFEPGWIFFGIPAMRLKENKYAEERRDIIIRRDVVKAKKYKEVHEVNIDEKLKGLIKTDKEVE